MKFGTRTTKGRVVYHRKHHAFKWSDLARIFRDLTEDPDLHDLVKAWSWLRQRDLEIVKKLVEELSWQRPTQETLDSLMEGLEAAKGTVLDRWRLLTQIFRRR